MRAQLFSEAGADILFVEAVTNAKETRAIPQRLVNPQLMNMVTAAKLPSSTQKNLANGVTALRRYGITALRHYGITALRHWYANAALQGAVAGMQKALTALRDTQRIDEDHGLVVSFAERQRPIGKPPWKAIEKTYQ